MWGFAPSLQAPRAARGGRKGLGGSVPAEPGEKRRLLRGRRGRDTCFKIPALSGSETKPSVSGSAGGLGVPGGGGCSARSVGGSALPGTEPSAGGGARAPSAASQPAARLLAAASSLSFRF